MASDPQPAPTSAKLAIRDAATLVLLDPSGPEPCILMGRRRADMAFMANKYVFPGGRVDPSDQVAPTADELTPCVAARLMQAMRGRASVARARGLAVAAIRETREETGLVLGAQAGPLLSRLQFFARAITPPGRSRRYDTRFFLANAGDLSTRTISGDGELTDVGWHTIVAAHHLDLPGITRMILDDIEQLLAHSHGSPLATPFYRHRAGQYRRDVLD